MRFLPDRFTLLLITTVIIASLLPAHGQGMQTFEWITNIAIALLFFLHGARLSRDAIVAGITHWRLHLTIFSATFIMFPILGLILRPVLEPLVTPELYLGILFLCCLPATVQSSIAFTSMARGNVPAAVCSASASSLLGIFITPLLVGIVVVSTAAAPISFDAVGKIMLQLLLPFVLGQVLRPWIGAWVHRRKALLKWVDQGSILLVVYTAFSEAVNEGLWHNTPIPALVGLLCACILILALALGGSQLLGKVFKFDVEDRITLLFCGSKKSLASGIPMAQVIFAGQAVGAIVLPLMLFHQIQLMVCAVLAARYARRPE
ncbi:bile acid:sodium symporter family protein [Bordetella avium]|uniref:Membrane protein n=1 Tax=Bordetella avium (strain 197N) TaxID=360910 RepID=Q2KZ28_BORA1|nr:bile acid:sodium symporter family protein [Bordetella avium]AZY49479.1 bile acid:sodium symporter [Bordetella avium]AZY52876.1 bile acid:sodium symporter [Bordetella avium]RIQ11744.1 bile acid:sodium symporter [Bordetella avium]RIQ16167.1 bile acid:sodium symporter [Bordetella avium]RIQ30320.1 bile acid:sodium symporter [Bordetella avium]